jgi:hypothetical protein
MWERSRPLFKLMATLYPVKKEKELKSQVVEVSSKVPTWLKLPIG